MWLYPPCKRYQYGQLLIVFTHLSVHCSHRSDFPRNTKILADAKLTEHIKDVAILLVWAVWSVIRHEVWNSMQLKPVKHVQALYVEPKVWHISMNSVQKYVLVSLNCQLSNKILSLLENFKSSYVRDENYSRLGGIIGQMRYLNVSFVTWTSWNVWTVPCPSFWYFG